MTRRYRDSSPHTRTPARPERLQTREHRRTAAVERLPELLPATCPSCRVVLGLVEEDGELLCRACGQWASADDEILGWVANG